MNDWWSGGLKQNEWIAKVHNLCGLHNLNKLTLWSPLSVKAACRVIVWQTLLVTHDIYVICWWLVKTKIGHLYQGLTSNTKALWLCQFVPAPNNFEKIYIVHHPIAMRYMIMIYLIAYWRYTCLRSCCLIDIQVERMDNSKLQHFLNTKQRAGISFAINTFDIM